MPLHTSAPTARLVQAYYWLTPVLFILSWQYGFDVRVPFLESVPGARTAYYAMCLACAALVTVRPGMTSIVGRAESSLSAGLLVLTTWIAWFNAIEAAAASDTAAFHNPFTPEALTSLVVSAGIFIASAMVRPGGAAFRTA